MKKLTRRELLKLGLVASGGAVLAACAQPTATPTPVPPTSKPAATAAGATAAPTAKPTAAPAATQVTTPITLRLLYYGGTGSLHYDEFSKRYADASNGRIKVSLELSPGDMASKQEADLVAGTLADLVRSDTSYWPYLASRGAWMVIEDLVAKQNMDLKEWFNIEWFRRFTNGKLSGLGGESGINHIVMFYNRPWVKEAWGKEPSEGWTIDDYVEMMTACVKLKGGKGKGFFGGNGPVSGGHVSDGFTRNWGGQYISNDGKKSLMTEEKEQIALKWEYDQVQSGNWPTPGDLAADGETKMFLNGKIASTAGGPGFVSGVALPAKEAGLDTGWVLFPTGPSYKENPPRRAFIAFSNPLSLYAKTKYPEEAFGLMLAITSVEAHKWITLKVGRQPGARLSTWYDPDVAAAFPMFPKIADIMKADTKDVYPMPANLRFSEWANVGANEIPPIIYGQVPFNAANWKTVNDHLQQVLDQQPPTTIIKPTATPTKSA